MKRQGKVVIDPDLYRIIRNFIRIQLFLFPLVALWRPYNSIWDGRIESVFHLAALGLLYLYLSSVWLQHCLSHWYYVFVLVLFLTEGPIAQIFALQFYPSDPALRSEIVAIQANWYAAVQIIPVIVIAWQWGLRAVISFGFAAVFSSMTITGIGFGFDTIATSLFFQTIGFHLVLFAAIGYVVHQLAQLERKQRHALQAANEKLSEMADTLEELAITRERHRLARELHDTLAHVQSGVAVQLEAVDTLWESDPTHARQILQKSLTTVRTGMSETRRALQALRASPLETQTLAAAIRVYAVQKTAHSRFKLNLQLSDDLGTLNDEVEQAVYRIVQESLTNIENHAQAQNVLITLAQNNGVLELCVQDDGRGFVFDKINLRTSFGIRGMREWAELIHGTLHVASILDQGTEIKLRVATN